MAIFGFEPVIRWDPLVVTQSDLVAFKRDRREWMLSNVLGLRLRVEPHTGPLVLGTRVHGALERYYGYGEDLVDAYDRLCAEEFELLANGDAPFYEREWRKEADLGRIMLAGYVPWLEETGADAEFQVVGVEEKLTHLFDIDGTPVELRGKIDLRVRNTLTGMNLVADFKTCKTFESFTETAHLSEQLKTYLTLERLAHRDNPDHHLQGAMFIMFRKVRQGATSKPPFYARHEVHHSQARLRSYYYQLFGTLRDYVHVVKALDAGVDHRLVAYPNPHPYTRYSAFKNVMDMFDDPGIEDMLHSLYTQRDPHARYDEAPADLLSQLA